MSAISAPATDVATADVIVFRFVGARRCDDIFS